MQTVNELNEMARVATKLVGPFKDKVMEVNGSWEDLEKACFESLLQTFDVWGF